MKIDWAMALSIVLIFAVAGAMAAIVFTHQ